MKLTKKQKNMLEKIYEEKGILSLDIYSQLVLGESSAKVIMYVLYAEKFKTFESFVSAISRKREKIEKMYEDCKYF